MKRKHVKPEPSLKDEWSFREPSGIGYWEDV
jgi:hypothetical protein